MTNPSGAAGCAKVISGEPLIPNTFGNEGKITGHYYASRLVDRTLCGWFEQFDTNISGAFLLTIGPNETLKGRRWMINEVPDGIRQDISHLSESLPGFQESVWIRVLKANRPEWAERYFREDWPRKYAV
jgi:hypothetical protein